MYTYPFKHGLPGGAQHFHQFSPEVSNRTSQRHDSALTLDVAGNIVQIHSVKKHHEVF